MSRQRHLRNTMPRKTQASTEESMRVQSRRGAGRCSCSERKGNSRAKSFENKEDGQKPFPLRKAFLGSLPKREQAREGVARVRFENPPCYGWQSRRCAEVSLLYTGQSRRRAEGVSRTMRVQRLVNRPALSVTPAFLLQDGRQNAWGGKSAKQREHKTENNRCGKMLAPQSAAREHKKDCPMRQDIV